eukprot:387180_1
MTREYHITKEYNELNISIYKAIRYNENMLCLVDLIVSYSMGLTVNCSNRRICKNQITISNMFDLINQSIDVDGNKIYYYEPKKQIKMKTVNMYNTDRRIFCNECLNNGSLYECGCRIKELRHCFIEMVNNSWCPYPPIHFVCINHTTCRICGECIEHKMFHSYWASVLLCSGCDYDEECKQEIEAYKLESKIKETMEMEKTHPTDLYKYKPIRKKFDSKYSNKWKVFRKDNKYYRSRYDTKQNQYSKKRIDKKRNAKMKRQIYRQQKHSLSLQYWEVQASNLCERINTI